MGRRDHVTARNTTTYTWLCRTELDRERMVATVRWVGPARAVMFVIVVLVVVGSATTPWLAMVPVLVAAGVSIPLYRNLEQRRRPEYWAAGGWLATQLSLGAGIALTGGPHSPGMPWLAIAVISLIARFSRVGIIAGLVFLFFELVAVTFGMDPSGVWQNPGEFLYPFALLFSVGIFSAAQMRSDLDHRDYDKTTGLPNQAKFIDDLRLAIMRRASRGGSVTVLSIDLDGFGLANDELGPRLGDELLRSAGGRIVRAARSADLVARRSADEFLVLMADLDGEPSSSSAATPTPRQTAQAAARAIQAEISRCFLVGEQEVYLDACVGISTLSTGHEEAGLAAEKLLAEAQSALSEARSTGQGTMVFYDHEQTAAESQLGLISRMRRAIDRGHFLMHYQPTINLHTRQLVGVEALLRWEDPERGMVMPGEFIPVAEQTGLIETIGMWGFEEVCRQAAEWQRAGHVFDVAFNLSPRQLQQRDLVDQMVDTINSTGVDARHLVIEITESTALRDPDHAITLMCQISQLGLRLAIDDFGVGLSSLSRLREMPATFLKIDRSFVSDLESSPTGLVMIRTMVQLAENLSMQPHAEGIETEHQLRLLLESGCELGQGFLFSKAIPAAEILEFDRRCRQSQYVPVLGGLPVPVTPAEI